MSGIKNSPVVRLLQLMHGERRLQMTLSVFFGLLFAITTLIPPLLVRQLIVWLTEGGGTLQSILIMVAGLGVIYVVRGISRYNYGRYSHVVAYKMLDDLLVRVYRHLQNLSHKFYNRQRTGSLIARSISDIEAIEDFIAHGIPEMVLALVVPIAMLAVLFFIQPWLTLLVLLPLPIAGFIVYRLMRHTRTMWRRVRSGLADLVAQVQDSFAGITEIKAFGREQSQAGLIREHSARYRDASIAANSVSLAPAGIVEFTSGVGLILAVWFGGNFALQGQMSVADLFIFVAYLSHIYQPFLKLADISDVLHKAASSCERVFELLDEPTEIVNPPNAQKPAQMSWGVALENVTFSYKDNHGQNNGASEPIERVLKEVSFTIPEGQMVALVGATGAGKSTINRLIPRFYDPQQGSVQVGGHDVRTLDLDFLRDHIAIVLQDVFLFHGTVGQNILFGRPDATEAEMVAAAQAANAHEFIDQLPDGYDTIIGERGVRLSGGQKQRLSIARALLKDAPILILDEATSSVDVHTEALIQEAFARLTHHRTTLVIAHRLSTIRHADKIIVLDDGEIVESGSHHKLLTRNGHYAKLVQAQEVASHWQIGTNGQQPPFMNGNGKEKHHLPQKQPVSAYAAD